MTAPGAPRPSAAVLRAFGAGGRTPVRLDGGRGETWRAGDVVLRPHGDVREARWRSDTLARLPHTAAFRTPRPVAAAVGGGRSVGTGAVAVGPAGVDRRAVDPGPVDPEPVDPEPVELGPVDPRPVELGPVDPRPVEPGSGDVRSAGPWFVDGWEAWEWLDGATDPARVEDVVRAGSAFEAALAGLDRPAFLDLVDDPWSRADRVVWEAGPARPDAPGDRAPRTDRLLRTDPLLRRLAGSFRPVRTPEQPVHGDLLGNVLFAPGQPPAVFDWAPYWRPAGYGAAVAAVDAVCWHGVPLRRLGPLGELAAAPEWPQLLVRALAFRVVTLHLLGAWDAGSTARHGPVVDALLSGAAGTLDPS
ncbi:hypothetical protein [Curtobacterium sp. MCBA15_004]|uniref:hypothetical protein n=1 Tax=unclassified Curtobacterium TaxID=257496 RepID=UPI0015875DBD|nr:hypothetical protein [Curtobacterium sp. MCBA15_004]WIA98124.1 hypothetical protein QOL16_06965 [Curtobacterium sp. MCBA15_004]